MSEKLKPCPFCGGKASVIDHHNDDGSVSVGCADDTCLGFSGLGWLYKTEEEAIAAWNTREERTCRMKQDGMFLVCSECGVVLMGNPRYCSRCGAKVVEE